MVVDPYDSENEIENDFTTELPNLSEFSGGSQQQLSQLFEQDVKSLEDSAESSRRVYR